MNVAEFLDFDKWAKSHSWKRLGGRGSWTPDGIQGGLTVSYMAPIGDTKEISVSCTAEEAEACMIL